MSSPICFDSSGEVLVDKILAAVEEAAHSYNNTTYWEEEMCCYKVTCIDYIEGIAFESAAKIKELREEIEILQAQLSESVSK